MTEWVFYKGLDSSDGDVQNFKGTVEELAGVANKIGAIAFNSLGFIKNKVKFPLEQSLYFGIDDGIYIRRNAITGLETQECLEDYKDLEIN